VRAVPGVHQEQFEVIALEAGPRVAFALAWLGSETAAPAAEPAPAEAAPPVADEEPEGGLAEPGGSPRPIAPEPLSPLDLQPDAEGVAVDAEAGFPILPRPERGEES
jgi:hypothetical protein